MVIKKILFFGSFIFTLFLIDIFIFFVEAESISTKGSYADLQKRRKNVKLISFNEGFSWSYINKNGFTGDTISVHAKENIFLVGGSFVESNQVFQRHHFMSEIKKIINVGNKNYSIINRGLGEQSLSDIYISFLTAYNDSSFFLIFINPDRLNKSNWDSVNKSYVYFDGKLRVKEVIN